MTITELHLRPEARIHLADAPPSAVKGIVAAVIVVTPFWALIGAAMILFLR